MHPEVLAFVRTIKARWPQYFVGQRVVEFGALDMNGSVRPLFWECEYVGVDARPGPGVDVVAVAHQVALPNADWDVVITTEMLEHDPFWNETLLRAVRLLRRDGMLIVTCAAPRRPRHDVEASVQPGYYRGLTLPEIVGAVLVGGDFAVVYGQYGREALDVYCWFGGRIPSD